jgi:fatty acid desaturase
MLKTLRIVFTIIAAAFLVAILPASSFWDWVGVIICIAGAALFWMLMLVCKSAQEKQEHKDEPKPGDFFHPSEAKPCEKTNKSEEKND